VRSIAFEDDAEAEAANLAATRRCWSKICCSFSVNFRFDMALSIGPEGNQSLAVLHCKNASKRFDWFEGTWTLLDQSWFFVSFCEAI
jgi:hypothetical protein